MRRMWIGVCAAALAGGAVQAQQAGTPEAAEPPHLCAAYTDAESGQTRLIDVVVTSEDPLRGVVKLGEETGAGFIGQRFGERCSILTAGGLRLQAVCQPGEFAGRFTISEGGDDDDDDGPPPVPVTFEPAACQ